MPRWSALLVALSLLLPVVGNPGFAAAQPTPPKPTLKLHGYAKAVGELGLADPYPFAGKARLQADLTGGFKVVDFRAMFDLDLDIGSVDPADLGDRTAEVRLIPVELRVNAHLGPVDISAGKQYVFWGQTDWVNPTDLFTPWDFVNISSELEDYRVAPWALRTTAYVRATSFDLVWVPWPQPSILDLESSLSDGVLLGDPDLPERSVKNSDIGFRFNTRFAGFDLSLMGFHGLDKMPGMTMDVDIDTTTMPPPPPVLTLTPTYHPINVVGGDLSWGAGPILLKSEVAYTWTEDRYGDDPTIRNPGLAAVLGLTVVPHSAVNFTVQGNLERKSRYDQDDEEDALADLGMPDPEADPRITGGLVERLSVDIKGVVSIQVVATQNLPAGDHFEMGYVSWRAVDGLTLLGGVVLFGGPEDSNFGRIKDYSRAFVEVKYSF